MEKRTRVRRLCGRVAGKHIAILCLTFWSRITSHDTEKVVETLENEETCADNNEELSSKGFERASVS